MQVFYAIQVLRAVAALSVVLFHMSILRVGEAGVDIFFVISGFIMGSVGVEQPPLIFLKKRLIRLVPLYWSVTLLMCAASLVPGMFSRFSWSVRELLLSLFFLPYYNAEGVAWPLVVPGWSLNAEMLFYVIFAFGLAAKRAVLLSSAVLLVLVAAGALFPASHAIWEMYTSPQLLEFVGGLWLARWVALRGRYWGVVLMAMGVIGFVGLHFTTHGLIEWRLLSAGVPALLLVAGAVAIERGGAWPRLLWPERLGDASYSLYLLHGLVIAAGHKLLGQGAFAQAGILAGAMLASLISY